MHLCFRHHAYRLAMSPYSLTQIAANAAHVGDEGLCPFSPHKGLPPNPHLARRTLGRTAQARRTPVFCPHYRGRGAFGRDHSPNAIAIPIATAPPKYPQFANTRYPPACRNTALITRMAALRNNHPTPGGSRRQNLISTLRVERASPRYPFALPSDQDRPQSDSSSRLGCSGPTLGPWTPLDSTHARLPCPSPAIAAPNLA
jgi:hypothetical protein